jgi:hypothetical protein
MRLLSLTKTVIIGVLMAWLAAGRSSIRLVYNNGEQLGWWWIDAYFDFSREQTPQVKAGINRLFAWHRSTQLVPYAALLHAAQAPVMEPTTAAEVCRWQARVRDALQPALERALQEGSAVVPVLGKAQFDHLQEHFAKGNADRRDKYLQDDVDERRDAAVKRALKWAEGLYGNLDRPQKLVVEAGVAASPFDAKAWLAERERWQGEALKTLQGLAAEHADPDRVLAALRALAERAERSTDPVYRAYREQLATYNCAFAARIHNATTPAQRQVARDRLKGWEDDLRNMAGKGAS